MGNMVYVLRHEYQDEYGCVETKSIGTFFSHEAAAAAARRAAALPGFCDYPEDFVIEPTTLDETFWTEGFDIASERDSVAAAKASARAAVRAIVPLKHHVRPSPNGYWIYELRRGDTSYGCVVGRVGAAPFAKGLAFAVAFQRALDDRLSISAS